MLCIDCNKEFKTQERELFQNHSKIHHLLYCLCCGICKENFTTSKELDRHDCRRVLKIVESKVNGFHPCKYCEKKFANEISLNLHIKIHLNVPLNEE